MTTGRWLRKTMSWAPLLGFIAKPGRRPGLSAIVRAKDEETWLNASLKSVAAVADEIIVGDNGSVDSTPAVLDRLSAELTRLKVLREPKLGIRDLTNRLIESSQYRWALRWDADFIAHTEGDCSIGNFKEWLMSLDSRRYAFVYPRMVELCGDLNHQRRQTPSRADCHCFVQSPQLRYVYDRAGYEAPRVPFWYQVLRYERPTFFHVDVKPAARMYRSFLWKRFLIDRHRRSDSFDDYLAEELAGTGSTLEEAAEEWMIGTFCDLVPYDQKRYGDHPKLLQPFLKKPPFRLIYRSGRIVARSEDR